MKGLDGKVALVTGAASGLGNAIAERLIAEGASVAMSDVADMPHARGSEASIFIRHNVTSEADWSAAIEATMSKFGRLDILVNNAGVLGILEKSNPEETELADWKRIFAVNVDGVFLGCRAAIPAMRRGGGGAIVNISSTAGLMSNAIGMAYGASKATVRHITKAVAQYGARWNIRCNSVHPGHLKTPMGDQVAASIAKMKQQSDERAYEFSASATPLGRLVTPQEVSAAVAFLVSDDAQMMSGAKMILDGGVIYCRSESSS